MAGYGQHGRQWVKVGATLSKIAAMLLSGEETWKILCTNNHVYKFAFIYQEVNSSNTEV